MIYVNDNKVKIQGYQKLLKVSDNEIVFMIFKKTVFVEGIDLSLSYFEKDEFELIGTINSITFK